MMLEHLLELPVGTQVMGEIDVAKAIPGVVELRKDGSHFIRWVDGFVTYPLGRVRDYDEYIAAHTQLALAQFEPCHPETVRSVNAAAPSVPRDTYLVRSA